MFKDRFVTRIIDREISMDSVLGVESVVHCYRFVGDWLITHEDEAS